MSYSAAGKLSETSFNYPVHKASRRRGRFVFKLGAALFLFWQSELEANQQAEKLQTPKELSNAMNYMWGHTHIAHWYAQHHPEGQRLCASVRAAGYDDALLLDADVANADAPGTERDGDAVSLALAEHANRLSALSEDDRAVRERLLLSMEGAWKEELGWRALGQPCTLQPVHYGLSAPIVFPSSRFVLVATPSSDASQGGTTTADADTLRLMIVMRSECAGDGDTVKRSAVSVTWHDIDALNQRMGSGFTDCWHTLLPFFSAQAARHLSLDTQSAALESPVLDEDPQYPTADVVDEDDSVHSELMLPAESPLDVCVPYLVAEEEEKPSAPRVASPRQGHVDALSRVYREVLQVLRCVPAAGADVSGGQERSHCSADVVLPATQTMPSAASGWLPLETVLRSVRHRLPPCLRLDGPLSPLVLEPLVLLVLLLRLDLQQQLQVMTVVGETRKSSEYAIADAGTSSSSSPLRQTVWLRAVWGHKQDAVARNVWESHSTLSLKSASDDVASESYRIPVPTATAASTPALLSWLATAASPVVDAAHAWHELVPSVAAWGMDLGFYHQSRLCPPRKPFLALLSPYVSGRLAAITAFYQRAASDTAARVEAAQAALDILDDAVRVPLSDALRRVTADPEAQRRALETALQAISPMEWLAAACDASQIAVLTRTTGDKMSDVFDTNTSALVPIKSDFISRHWKTTVQRACPSLHKDGGSGKEAAASGAEASRALWLLSVFAVHEAFCPLNGSRIAMGALYQMRTMKAQTTLPLVRLPIPDWWEPVKRHEGHTGTKVAAIATHPLSLPATVLYSPSDKETSSGRPPDRKAVWPEHVVYVVPPRRSYGLSEASVVESSAEAEPTQCPLPSLSQGTLNATSTNAATAAAAHRNLTSPGTPLSTRTSPPSLSLSSWLSTDLLATPPEFPLTAVYDCLHRVRKLCTDRQAQALVSWAAIPAVANYTDLGKVDGSGGAHATSAAAHAHILSDHRLSTSQLAVWRGLREWTKLCHMFHDRRPFSRSQLRLWLPPAETPSTLSTEAKPIFKFRSKVALSKLRDELSRGPSQPFAPLFLDDKRAVTDQCVLVTVAETLPHKAPSTVLIGAQQMVVFHETKDLDEPTIQALTSATPSALFFAPWSDSATAAAAATTTTTTPARPLSLCQYLAAPAVSLSPDGYTPSTWPSASFLELATVTSSAIDTTAKSPSVALIWSELRLNVCWSADQLVDALFCPPLFACIRQHALMDTMDTRARSETSASAAAGACDDRTREARITAQQTALRQCLVTALTDVPTMQRYEFVGDALLDYLVSLRTLSFTNSMGTPLWDDNESLTARSTNENLAQALPLAVRHFLATAHGFTNEKRCADVVESLFGAVVAALWSRPLKDGAEPDMCTMFRCATVLMESLTI